MEEKRDYKSNKSFRLLNIYEKLNRGDNVTKSQLANEFGVTPKTIQRDIGELKIYLAETYKDELDKEIIYEIKEGHYKLKKTGTEWITNKEALIMIKILLDGRSLNKEELNQLIEKLLLQVEPKDRTYISKLINSERMGYVQPIHKKPLIDIVWELSDYIHKNEIITYTYQRQDGKKKTVTVKPVALMVSEYYFYLIAYKVTDKAIDDIDKKDDYAINYRVDRITNLSSTGEKFDVLYSDRFQDGEFRKRVQFMYSGEPRTIKFEFTGPSVEAILDRIPTAKILKEIDGVTTIEAECDGEGVEMWLRTQGDNVRFI